VLFLDAHQDVLHARELPSTEFFPQWIQFSVAALGDLDGDGRAEIVTGFHDYFAAGTDARALALGFLHADGSLKKHLLITMGSGGLDFLPDSSGFGIALAPLGDLRRRRQPGPGGGRALRRCRRPAAGAWVLSLDTERGAQRLGRESADPRAGAEPALGQSWERDADCGGHAPGLALLAGCGPADRGPAPGGGRAPRRIRAARACFSRTSAHAGGPVPFSSAVPADPALVGLADLRAGAVRRRSPGRGSATRSTVIVGR
jgi:hypothetical protein